MRDQWGLPILPDPTDHPTPKGTPPGHSIEYWEKKISYRVFVDGDVSLGEFCSLLRECWADAYAKGVRDAKR